MRAGSLPEEFQQPLAHSGWWLVLALALLAAVALYYLAVILLTRERPPVVEVETPWVPEPRDLRAEHLAEIDRIERSVHRGDVPARVGHQHLSRTVRDYVAEVSQIPADKMVLADLKATVRSDPRTRPLAMAVEVMYPPAFASEEEGQAAERFPEALSRARQVVSTWT